MATIEGLTMFGTPQTRSIIGASCSTRELNKPGMISLLTNNAGTVQTYYLWVDTSGVLRIDTAIPTDQDNDGTVVGAQT